jgi:hypothetical protein
MPFFSDLYTLGTAASQVCPPANVPQHVTIHNHEKSSNHFIHIGGSAGISTANSIHLDNSETYTFMLPPGESVFALGTADGYKLGVMRMFY